MPENDYLVEMRGISKTYPGVKALQDVDFGIKRGEVHCLVGENGSGKSTLIKVLSGVVSPDKGGEIWFNGKRHSRLRAIDSISEGIEVIYQDLSLFPDLTVKENIAVSEMIRNRTALMKWKHAGCTAQQALDRLCVSLDLEAVVGRLSRAQQQCVAIARALSCDARLIVMDEPTASLSKHEIDSLLYIVDKLRHDGVSTLFVSHKLDEVLAVCNRVSVLRDGESVGVFDRDELSIEKVTTLMTGREISDTRCLVEHQSETVMEVSGLCRKHEYQDVSFSVRKGEILGFIGLLGSGRTELMLSLYGITKPTSGTIMMGGARLVTRNPRDAISRGISYLPEDRLNEGLFLQKPIVDNVVTSSLNKRVTGNGWVKNSKNRKLAREWVDMLQIKTPSIDEVVQRLSGGNQQRVVLAKCLATNPRVLILDGPTIGVDIKAKENMQSMIREIAAKGIGIILVSDEIDEVVNNCNRILVMKQGRIDREFQSRDHDPRELKAVIANELR